MRVLAGPGDERTFAREVLAGGAAGADRGDDATAGFVRATGVACATETTRPFVRGGATFAAAGAGFARALATGWNAGMRARSQPIRQPGPRGGGDFGLGAGRGTAGFAGLGVVPDAGGFAGRAGADAGAGAAGAGSVMRRGRGRMLADMPRRYRQHRRPP